MKVFIAGATGVIGRRTVRQLVARGHAVAGLSRSKANAEWLAANGAEPRKGDLFRGDSLVAASSDAEAIVNLATAIPTGSRPARKDWRLNDRIRTEGTANLLAAAVSNRCRLFVQESVTFLYGDRSGAPTDESVPAADDLPSMVRSAVEMERMVRRADAGNAISATILRFGWLYAHDAAHTASMFSLIRRGKMPVIAGGKAVWCPVHADDAAGAVVSAVEHPGTAAGKTYNVCDDEPVPSGVLLRHIAGLLGAPGPGSVPSILARLFLGGDALNFLTASSRCRNDAVKTDLGWRPSFPTYREGMLAEVGRWGESAGKM